MAIDTPITQVEAILAKIMDPSNEAANKKGMAELKSEVLKSPSTIARTLLTIGLKSSSSDAKSRRYALVLLRKQLSRDHHWEQLPSDLKTEIKTGLLEALSAQSLEESVRNSAAKLVGAIANHELEDGDVQWPELLETLQKLCGSPTERELGFLILSYVADSTGDELVQSHMKPFIPFFHSALDEVTSGAAFYAGMAMKELIPYISKEHLFMIEPLIPKVEAVIKHLIVKDEERAVQLMDLWEELIDSDANLVSEAQLKAITEQCLKISSNKDTMSDPIRVQALHFLCSLARLKNKPKEYVVKENNLVDPILKTLFEVMKEEEEDNNNEDVEEVELKKPHLVAAQVLNELALHLPEETLSPLLHWAETTLKGSDFKAQGAVYSALGVVAEGVEEYVRPNKKQLGDLIQWVCKGVRHSESEFVRLSAMYCLAEFLEHFQPEIEEYVDDLLPVLFDHLSGIYESLAAGRKVPKSSIDRVFYALEMFCEAMEQKLVPHLPELMDQLFSALKPSFPMRIRELALSTIGSAASAVEKDIVPYFSRIMDHLKVHLNSKVNPEDKAVQVQALDTLGTVSQTVSEKVFEPYAMECLQSTLKLIKDQEDPELRKFAFVVFSSVSSVLKEKLSPSLSEMVEHLLKAVESTEGIAVYKLKDEDDLSSGDLLEKEEEDDTPGYSTVEISYLEEKEEACVALGELAVNARAAFRPFIEKCTGPVNKLVDYAHEDVRGASLMALSQFCICLSTSNKDEQACIKAVNELLPKLLEAVNDDTEMDVVVEALDSLSELLKELKGLVLKTPGHLDSILEAIKNTFSKTTQCQLMEDDPDNDPEDSELAEKMTEYAGDVLPALGLAMTPKEFAPIFSGLLPSILERTKKDRRAAEKSFSAGLLAVCMEPLDGQLESFAETIYSTLMALMKEEDPEVRNNAIFGLGELVLHGRELMTKHFPEILTKLSAVVSTEENPLAVDNICGAISRLIVTNKDAVPMEQVFPVLMKHLPLREDFQENEFVLKCFLKVSGDPLFKTHLDQVLVSVAAMIGQEEELEAEQKPLIKEVLNIISKQFGDVYLKWSSSLKAEAQLKMKEIVGC